MYFDETQLNDNVLDALYDMRFDQCTPIQEKCIPPILEGRDLLGVAQTGTGKTAAYLLPILSKLDDGGYPHDAINCVIMSPTRELAQQIDQAMQLRLLSQRREQRGCVRRQRRQPLRPRAKKLPNGCRCGYRHTGTPYQPHLSRLCRPEQGEFLRSRRGRSHARHGIL